MFNLYSRHFSSETFDYCATSVTAATDDVALADSLKVHRYFMSVCVCVGMYL